MSKKLLDKIHKYYDMHMDCIAELQTILAPYLEEYLQGETPHILIRADESDNLFIVDPTNSCPLNYRLDKDHIDYIKRHKKINTDLIGS